LAYYSAVTSILPSAPSKDFYCKTFSKDLL
jgi:hypothetical protein